MTAPLADIAHGRTILIVENDRDVRDIVADVLEASGYRTLTAEHGRAALDQLAATPERPVAILLDMSMPVMNGWEFLAHKRRDARIADIPVIATSGDRSLRAGVGLAAVLPKPMTLPTLLATLARVGS